MSGTDEGDLAAPGIGGPLTSPTKMPSFATMLLRLSLPQKLVEEISTPFYVLAAHLIISMFAIAMIELSSKVLAIDGLGERKILFDITVEVWFFYIDVVSVSLILSVGVLKCIIRMWKNEH